jgi:hypothetical protein
LFNINGQSIATWDIVDQSEQNIQLPIKKFKFLLYIVKLYTTAGELNKKIIIPKNDKKLKKKNCLKGSFFR